MIVIVDSNEFATNPKAVENMRKVYPNLQKGNLKAGDVNIITDNGKRIAIERKKPYDFLASIADGRLFNQVERMSTHDASCVIVTGKFNYDINDMVVVNHKVTKWRGKSVRAAKIVVQMSGCPVLWSTDILFPYTMEEFVAVASKPSTHQQGIRKRRVVTFPPSDSRVDILSQFNGVGRKRATSLLEFVGNGKGLGTLAAAIEWGTSVIPHLKEKPAMWGTKTIMNFRTVLGLAENEYIVVKEEKSNE